ncbi:MAG: DUF4423 domain-containing protein [Bdellovibrionales bacterium]|nr:DUF4423 domain-containing protein [Bdellovibrionales bacterium]
MEECFSKILHLADESKNKDAVYHLGIQLFNLTKPGILK